MSCGIYAIENLKTGKIYIGSSLDIEHRFSHHLFMLRSNKHSNPYLQNSWNKHGEDSFLFYIVEVTSDDLLVDREQYYIDNLDCYNNRPAGRRDGFTVSVETIEKISVAAKEVGTRPEQKAARSFRAIEQHKNGNFGRKTWTELSQSSFNEACRKRSARKIIRPIKIRDYSAYPGVSGIPNIIKERTGWKASVPVEFSIPGQSRYIGCFATLEEAVLAQYKSIITGVIQKPPNRRLGESKIKGIQKNQGKWRVFASNKYIGDYSSLEEAIDAQQTEMAVSI